MPVIVLLLLLEEQAEEKQADCKLGCYIDRKCVQQRTVPNAINLQDVEHCQQSLTIDVYGPGVKHRL